MTNVVYPLFRRDGGLNPTHARSYPFFVDQDTGEIRSKQDSSFDGGWRWFESDLMSVITIYNTKYDPRAFADIPQYQIENWVGLMGGEFILYCAQSWATLEHNFYSANDYVQNQIKWQFRKARQEILREIRG